MTIEKYLITWLKVENIFIINPVIVAAVLHSHFMAHRLLFNDFLFINQIENKHVSCFHFVEDQLNLYA